MITPYYGCFRVNFRRAAGHKLDFVNHVGPLIPWRLPLTGADSPHAESPILLTVLVALLTLAAAGCAAPTDNRQQAHHRSLDTPQAYASSILHRPGSPAGCGSSRPPAAIRGKPAMRRRKPRPAAIVRPVQFESGQARHAYGRTADPTPHRRRRRPCDLPLSGSAPARGCHVAAAGADRRALEALLRRSRM